MVIENDHDGSGAVRSKKWEVQRRAKTAIFEVPEETRKALEDGNTEYLRPLPTASRMYVETDIPATSISREYLEEINTSLPELPNEKKDRIMKEYGLSEDLASQLVKNSKADDFEKLKATHTTDSITIASTLAYTIIELRREGLKVETLNLDILGETFSLVDENKIPAASVPAVLRSVALHGYSAQEAASKEGLEKLREDDVEKIIDEIIFSNTDLIKERGMAAMGSLMGIAMKKLKGKADGKLVNKLIKDKLISFTKE